jgi:hypothetical protein
MTPLDFVTVTLTVPIVLPWTCAAPVGVSHRK